MRDEAKDLGLEVTEDPDSVRFRTGKAILVANIYKLVNGRSVFGVEGSQRTPIDLGCVVIDDAHASLTTVQEQFTLQVPASHSAYDDLLELFAEALEAQSPSAYRDLLEGVPSVALQIPYWVWANKQEAVLNILHPIVSTTLGSLGR